DGTEEGPPKLAPLVSLRGRPQELARATLTHDTHLPLGRKLGQTEDVELGPLRAHRRADRRAWTPGGQVPAFARPCRSAGPNRVDLVPPQLRRPRRRHHRASSNLFRPPRHGYLAAAAAVARLALRAWRRTRANPTA